MESLRDILKKTIPTSTTNKSTDTWFDAKVRQGEFNCPICQDIGFVRLDVPLGHPDFGRAIPCECTLQEMEETRITRLQRYSNLGPLTRLTFANLMPQGRSSDPANQKRFEHAYMAAQAYAQNPQGWLLLTGVSGCGKTHLAAAIANQLLGQGRPALFIIVPDLLDHLRATYNPATDISYDELFEEVRNAPFLVLDDLGSQSTTPWAQEKLFQIVNHRFNLRLPTVVTSNITAESLEERLRTRLTDPELSQVCVLEESSLPLFQQMGSWGLELLTQMTFENFDPRGLGLVGEERRNLEEAFRLAREFAQTPQGWLVFQGGHGCGKTHLAAAIANYRLRASQPIFFVVVADLLDHLRSTFSPESKVTYDELFERIRKTPLLILDDLGTLGATPWAQEKLYQIINHRYNARLPVVITTTFTLDELEGRISSRMVDPRLSVVFNIRAPDYRGDRRPVEHVPSRPRRGSRK